MNTLNTINFVNLSGLDPKQYSVWIAGYIQDAGDSAKYYILAADGNFACSAATNHAAFRQASAGLTIQVPDVANTGTNRLVVTVTKAGAQPAAYPLDGYTAYPFAGVPGVSPAGPYDIFEFGPNAQYDVSAVDSLGLNLSFCVAAEPTSFGVSTSVARKQIATAFVAFTKSDPQGAPFSQLLYTSPSGAGYPDSIEGQFSAIVSPKDWLAIFPEAQGLNGYWRDTIEAFFKPGNQLSLFLNGATVGTYRGSCDGEQYTLVGPSNLTVRILKADFVGNQPFIQAVRAQHTGESSEEYAAFGQIEAAIFESFSRGVALDGVGKKGDVLSATYTSDAWTNTTNWFTDHANAYNGKPSLYDAYAKFLHYSSPEGTVGGDTIFGKNSSGAYAMAYGFSLDENPNVGSTALEIPPSSWPKVLNTPSKTPGSVGGGQTVTLVLGPWETTISAAVFQVSMVSQNDQPNPSCAGCSAGEQLRGQITKVEGASILQDPPAGYPANVLPFNEWVSLPFPGQAPNPATPTWFLMVEAALDDVVIHAEIETPAQGGEAACLTQITLRGTDMKSWVDANKVHKANQIYKTGCCGIFGYAQHNSPAGQPPFWIYTLTGGVCDPKVHGAT